MNALNYPELADLCDRKLGTRDVACPLCGPGRRAPENRKRRVLRVFHKESGFASYCCARCGAEGYARADGAARQRDLPFEAPRELGEDHAARQRDKARWLWRQRKPITGSPAEGYLRNVRGYGGDLPTTLRYLPPTKPEHHPALVAAFGLAKELEPGILHIDVDSVAGVHLTLLKPDGSGKADTEPNKIMVGPSKGLPVIIAPANDLLAIAVTEGVEDGLSVYEATGLGAWVAGAAGRMPALADAIPASIEAATIYQHDDEAGRLGARALADALIERGVETFMEAAW